MQQHRVRYWTPRGMRGGCSNRNACLSWQFREKVRDSTSHERWLHRSRCMLLFAVSRKAQGTLCLPLPPDSSREAISCLSACESKRCFAQHLSFQLLSLLPISWEHHVHTRTLATITVSQKLILRGSLFTFVSFWWPWQLLYDI